MKKCKHIWGEAFKIAEWYVKKMNMYPSSRTVSACIFCLKRKPELKTKKKIK